MPLFVGWWSKGKSDYKAISTWGVMGELGGRSPERGQREEMEGKSGRILFQLKTCLKIRKEKL